MTKAVNQLAAGQKATSSLGTSAKSQVIVNAASGGGGGLGPMIVPRISGRTITTNLMRDALASNARAIKRATAEAYNLMTPLERDVMTMRHGSAA